jgi:porphobilinogen deaminase
MPAYNESAHAFFKWDPAKGEYPNLVLFAIWDQRSEDQSASDEWVVRERLAAAHAELAAPGAVDLVIIRTTGDRLQDRALAEIGGKGLFTKEIEEALLNHTVDLAVHSMKDVPTELPSGLEIVCLLSRDDRAMHFCRPGRTALGN